MASSRLTNDMEHCFACGRYGTEVHHIFFGTANRKISDQLGYVVPLCPEHHRGRTGAHQNRVFDLWLKKIAREDYLLNFGDLNDFISTFGNTWIYEERNDENE